MKTELAKRAQKALEDLLCGIAEVALPPMECPGAIDRVIKMAQEEEE